MSSLITTVALTGLLTSLLEEEHHSYPPSSPYFGMSALCLEQDVDEDGIDDIAVGDPSYGPKGGRDAVWVVSGKSGRRIGSISSDSPGFGASLLLLGDIDADGASEVIVAALGDERNPVRVSAHDVRTGHLHWTTEIATRANPISIEGGGGGVSLVRVNDVDSDGIPDLGVGASFVKRDLNSGVWMGEGGFGVVSGKDGSILWFRSEQGRGLGFPGAIASHVCWSSHGQGSDGAGTLLVGLPGWPTDRKGVIEGRDPRTGQLIEVIQSPSGNPAFGLAFSECGDFDGDDVMDLVVPTPGVEAYKEDVDDALTVYSRRSGKPIFSQDAPKWCHRKGDDPGSGLVALEGSTLVLSARKQFYGSFYLLHENREQTPLRPPDDQFSSGNELLQGWGCGGTRLGDLDGDGHDEVAVQSRLPWARNGQLWVFSGEAFLAEGTPASEPHMLGADHLRYVVSPREGW